MNIKEIALAHDAEEMPLDDVSRYLSRIQTGSMTLEEVFASAYISGYLRSHPFPEPPEEAMKALLEAAKLEEFIYPIVAAYKMGYLLKN